MSIAAECVDCVTDSEETDEGLFEDTELTSCGAAGELAADISVIHKIQYNASSSQIMCTIVETKLVSRDDTTSLFFR